jgi:excinuclease UvrABC helicase subunit UvrB
MARPSAAAKQIATTGQHGITPTGVTKRIKDIIDGVYDADTAARRTQGGAGGGATTRR